MSAQAQETVVQECMRLLEEAEQIAGRLNIDLRTALMILILRELIILNMSMRSRQWFSPSKTGT